MKITNMKEAVSIANEIERYETALKTMKDNLKKFVEANGPVDTGDKLWGFSESVSWSFNADKLKELSAEILMLGHNPWEYLSLGSREIKKLELNENLLKQYGSQRTTRRFSGTKSASSGVKSA